MVGEDVVRLASAAADAAAESAAKATDAEEVLRYARALIAAPSENPGGTEDHVADVVTGILTDLGADIRIVRSEEGRPSVVARLGSGERPDSPGTDTWTPYPRETPRPGRAVRSRARWSTAGSWDAGRVT